MAYLEGYSYIGGKNVDIGNEELHALGLVDVDSRDRTTSMYPHSVG